MVALPAGEFMMGSPADERWREVDEGLPRLVVIKKPIAIGRFEVTVDQFSAFVAETGTTAGSRCVAIVGDSRNLHGSRFIMSPPDASFRQPGYAVTGTHPVVCISWHDAQEYVDWLKRRTGKPYRLPTESEWEYAGRAGTQTMYSFGNNTDALCAYGRFAALDNSLPMARQLSPRHGQSHSGWSAPAQSVGNFRYAWQRLGMGRGLLDSQCIGNPYRWVRIFTLRELWGGRHARRRLGQSVSTAKVGSSTGGDNGGSR